MTAPKPPKVPNPPRRSSLRPAAAAFGSGGENSPPAPAAPAAKAPAAKPEEVIYRRDGSAIRPKPVRITVDLDHERYSALVQWLVSASVAVDPDTPRRIGIAQGIRAMLDATTKNEAVTAVVLDQLRREK